ncbi:hypothetical protein BD626DRAFT_574745 [Schizophyllum amplum]|uniref:Uncharacterized protein n=1 Tax=Schizophyllum amplum TaxID=97359 RepID=A0A550BXM7_9AGAR|nr:hypothetical protein BD626DRAFT_574745 [Auriculariopsis ampla]
MGRRAAISQDPDAGSRDGRAITPLLAAHEGGAQRRHSLGLGWGLSATLQALAPSPRPPGRGSGLRPRIEAARSAATPSRLGWGGLGDGAGGRDAVRRGRRAAPPFNWCLCVVGRCRRESKLLSGLEIAIDVAVDIDFRILVGCVGGALHHPRVHHPACNHRLALLLNIDERAARHPGAHLTSLNVYALYHDLMQVLQAMSIHEQGVEYMYRRPPSDVLDVLLIVVTTVVSPIRAPWHLQGALDIALNLRCIAVGDEYMDRRPASEVGDEYMYRRLASDVIDVGRH